MPDVGARERYDAVMSRIIGALIIAAITVIPASARAQVSERGYVFVAMTQHTRNAPVLATMPNVVALGGGVAIKADNEIVAGLGVGGAPGDTKDEVCAKAGVAKIQNQLPQ